VTGAGGFVGRHFLSAARAAWPDAWIAAGVRNPATPVLSGADAMVAFDMLDAAAVNEAVALARPDACVHLAAFSDVAASFGAGDVPWRVNVDGTRLLAAALQAHTPACVLVHVGSADCYGLSYQAGRALDESAPLRPANPYAASKAAADVMLGERALHGLTVVRLRPVNHVGPGQSPRFAVAAFARQVARVTAGMQAPVIRTGALDRWRDFLDVSDVCAAYVRAVERARSLPPGAVFNLASGTPRRVGDVLADLLRLAGVDAAVEASALPPRPVDIARACCSAAAARVSLGWAPQVTWLQTLTATLADWRDRVGNEDDGLAR
jgi:GDP-4-dehydro-6-deoxy-D-mannose reductase